MRLSEATSKFWAAAQYIRHAAPNAPLRGQAHRILCDVALKATGAAQQRAADMIENTDEPTCYNG